MNTVSQEPRWYFVSNDFDAQVVHSPVRPKTHYDGGPWSSVHGGLDTREELEKAACLQPDPCKKCGRMFGASYEKETKAKMLAAGICFSCNFWTEYVQQRDNPRIARIKGAHWCANPTSKEDSRFLGCGGRKFRIRWRDGREEETNNLWHQGTIPEHFRDELPDNADFVEQQESVGHGQGYLGIK